MNDRNCLESVDTNCSWIDEFLALNWTTAEKSLHRRCRWVRSSSDSYHFGTTFHSIDHLVRRDGRDALPFLRGDQQQQKQLLLFFLALLYWVTMYKTSGNERTAGTRYYSRLPLRYPNELLLMYFISIISSLSSAEFTITCRFNNNDDDASVYTTLYFKDDNSMFHALKICNFIIYQH